MTKRYGKKDDNQDRIVSALRSSGCTVTTLASVGGGCPDLLVGRGGECGKGGTNYLLEIKDGSKPPSKRKLTPDQVTWHSERRGQVAIFKKTEEALKAVGAIK